MTEVTSLQRLIRQTKLTQKGSAVLAGSFYCFLLQSKYTGFIRKIKSKKTNSKSRHRYFL